MNLRKISKALLFPPMALMIILVPIATVLLVGSMLYIGTESPIAIASYVLSAYTLTVWCCRIPRLIRYFKIFQSENRYARLWRDNTRLRVNVSLYASFVWNAMYGAFQLWLGFFHKTVWFCSFGVYYICLAVMRFFLLRYTRKYRPGEKMRSELERFRICGWVFLIMNLALSLIVFFMVYWNRTFEHHMITAIAMAAYTFTALISAIISVVKYRKYQSPVFSASKIIGLAAALVSMLTLTSTMISTFGDGTITATQRKWMLGSTGGAISAMIVLAAIYMIVSTTEKLKILKKEVKNGVQSK